MQFFRDVPELNIEVMSCHDVIRWEISLTGGSLAAFYVFNQSVLYTHHLLQSVGGLGFPFNAIKKYPSLLGPLSFLQIFPKISKTAYHRG